MMRCGVVDTKTYSYTYVCDVCEESEKNSSESSVAGSKTIKKGFSSFSLKIISLFCIFFFFKREWRHRFLKVYDLYCIFASNICCGWQSHAYDVQF